MFVCISDNRRHLLQQHPHPKGPSASVPNPLNQHLSGRMSHWKQHSTELHCSRLVRAELQFVAFRKGTIGGEITCSRAVHTKGLMSGKEAHTHTHTSGEMSHKTSETEVEVILNQCSLNLLLKVHWTLQILCFSGGFHVYALWASHTCCCLATSASSQAIAMCVKYDTTSWSNDIKKQTDKSYSIFIWRMNDKVKWETKKNLMNLINNSESKLNIDIC